MGYTHYYTLKKANQKKFALSIEVFQSLVEILETKFPNLKAELNYSISKVDNSREYEERDGFYADKNKFFFDDKNDEGETFFIENKSGVYNFTKTCRGKYDVYVCLALLSFKKCFGDDFTFRSDGEILPRSVQDTYSDGSCDEGWADAYEVLRYFTEFFGTLQLTGDDVATIIGVQNRLLTMQDMIKYLRTPEMQALSTFSQVDEVVKKVRTMIKQCHGDLSTLVAFVPQLMAVKSKYNNDLSYYKSEHRYYSQYYIDMLVRSYDILVDALGRIVKDEFNNSVSALEFE